MMSLAPEGTRTRRSWGVLALVILGCGGAKLPILASATDDGAGDDETVTNGLVGHFRMDETVVGAAVVDSSPQKADGNPVNGPVPSLITAPLQLPNPRSLEFDGNRRQQVDLTGAYPRVNAPQTLAVWFRYLATNIGTLSQDLMSTGDFTTSAVQFGIRRDPGAEVVTLAAWKRIGDHLCEGPLPSQDAWHHVAYTFDGTAHSCYIDGVLVGTSTVAPQRGPATVARLGNSPGQGEPFTGWLDDARIYDRALAAAEIAHLAAGLP